jgi:hypothetical protein
MREWVGHVTCMRNSWFSRKKEKRVHLRDIVVSEKIILKWMLKK